MEWSGTRSSFVDVEFGVRQGSILGQTLFLVLMADLPDCLQLGETSNVGYADDVAIWAATKDLATLKTVLEDQADLFARFATGNGLVLNSSKTQFMLGGKFAQTNLADFKIAVKGIAITPGRELELLGVKFDQNFSTSPHAAFMAASASQKAAMIA